VPGVYVSLGLLLGSCAVRALQPLDADTSCFVLAACAFGNSTGLPLVLLTLIRDALLSPAVRQQYGDGVDPLSYLSLYLLTYPLLQWTVGAILTGLGSRHAGQGGDVAEEEGGRENGEEATTQSGHALTTSPSATRPLVDLAPSDDADDTSLLHSPGHRPKRRSSIADWLHARSSPRWRRRAAVVRQLLLPQLLNPPVLATLAGGAVGLLPKVVTKALSNSFSPLGWVMPAAKQLSGAAVPVNLLLLGSSLHAALSEGAEPSEAEDGGRATLARVRGVVAAAGGSRLLVMVTVTKLVLHPLCAAIVCAALRALLPAVPDPYDDAFWLTALLLAATPTANNVLVMVSAAGGDTRRASAAIAAQYLAAPLLLTASVSLFLVIVATKV
jgi:predicted permease